LILKIPAQATNNSAAIINGGRVTIYVEGDLTINKDFGIANSSANPLLAPSLAIVVDGNVNIASSVKNLKGQIYANGKINTCTTSTGTAATTNECSVNQLNVNKGALIAKRGFDFRRTFIDETNRGAAELITLNSQSIVFPPPGIESRYFYNDFSGYKLDTSEYSPIF
jgi:choice-of-anchor A domain-containing protein